MLNRTMRPAMIQTQNMSVLMVEFTRVPLFRRWRSLKKLSSAISIFLLDGGTPPEAAKRRDISSGYIHPFSRFGELSIQFYSQGRESHSILDAGSATAVEGQRFVQTK
jgi:hypothetical protein